jgi:transposase InsO family protein
VEGALLHSDQGILYLTDEFQREVAAMGMSQSMSKRGNCWDNAPQESFFGHFKDECHYEDCESFEQLQQLLDEYAYYYNHERHQWGRRQMTPIQYEEWMEGLSDEEFEEYLRSEQARYDSMKEKAEEKAIARAKTLGV